MAVWQPQTGAAALQGCRSVRGLSTEQLLGQADSDCGGRVGCRLVAAQLLVLWGLCGLALLRQLFGVHLCSAGLSQHVPYRLLWS